ncbi:uncharacterized protein LOC126866817 [Bombus huntii]|nr:uncharacterized protein LOC126866817 [Bombus huntii]
MKEMTQITLPQKNDERSVEYAARRFPANSDAEGYSDAIGKMLFTQSRGELQKLCPYLHVKLDIGIEVFLQYSTASNFGLCLENISLCEYRKLYHQHYAAYQVHTKCCDVPKVLWITNAKVKKVTRFLFRFEMYATNSRPVCNNNLSEQQQVKLQKIKELTRILKDTDKNLTVCEEILATYIRKRLRDKRQEMQRRSELEHKMTEILENLKTRLLVE